MAQADLQAAQNDVQVVLARAVIVNLGAVGEAIEEKIGRPIVLSEDLAALQQPDQEQVNEAIGQIFKPLAEQAFNARAVGSISFLQGFVQFIKQAAQADWAVGDRKDYLLNLSKLLSQPVIAEDAAVGVCPIPVYAFTEDELASIHAGSDSDEVRDILSRHNLFQYFFPAPDQTALGLIERAPKEVEIIDAVEVAPTIGHPLGSDELVPQSTTLPELLDQLRERDYVAQVDYGWELTEAGKEVRAHIRATPREGLVSKLLNRVSVKINLRSIFKIGP